MKRWLSPHKAQRPCVGVVVRAAATGRIKGTRVPGALALPGREGQCRNHNFIIKIIFVITLYRPRTKPRPLSPIRGKPTLLLLVSPLSPIALQWVLSPRGKQISHGGAGPVQFSFLNFLHFRASIDYILSLFRAYPLRCACTYFLLGIVVEPCLVRALAADCPFFLARRV